MLETSLTCHDHPCYRALSLCLTWGAIASMGTKSLKRRLRESQNPPMAAAVPPRRKPRSYVTLSVLLSAVLMVSVIALLVLSSNNWRAFQSRASYGTFTVVNVFPHDPEAFTQVNLFLSFFELVYNLMTCVFIYTISPLRDDVDTLIWWLRFWFIFRVKIVVLFDQLELTIKVFENSPLLLGLNCKPWDWSFTLEI